MNILAKKKCFISGTNNALFWGLFFLTLLAMHSCRQSRCLLCETDKTKLYRVELKEGAAKTIGKEKVETFFAPVPIEAGKKKMNLYLIDCEGTEPFRFSEEELEQFVMKNTLVVDTTMVTRIITTSDADQPPVLVQYASLEGLRLCNRYRQPLKLELRGILGSRLDWNNEPSLIEGYPYERNDLWDKVMGFGEGGTNLIVGGEAALMYRVATFGKRHSFSPGILTGIWPVDGGLFLPLSLHPRFTFNDLSMPLWGRCSAWYAYGDLGTALDLGGDVPLISNNWLTSWFAGLGFGRDFWISKKCDFSLDLGYRFSHLALPHNPVYQECLENAGIEQTVDYPARRAGQFFIRFGFTW